MPEPLLMTNWKGSKNTLQPLRKPAILAMIKNYIFNLISKSWLTAKICVKSMEQKLLTVNCTR